MDLSRRQFIGLVSICLACGLPFGIALARSVEEDINSEENNNEDSNKISTSNGQSVLYVKAERESSYEEGESKNATIYLHETTSGASTSGCIYFNGYGGTAYALDESYDAENALLVDNEGIEEILSNLYTVTELCNSQENDKMIVLLKEGTTFYSVYADNVEPIYRPDTEKVSAYDIELEGVCVANGVDAGDFLVIPAGWKFHLDPAVVLEYNLEDKSDELINGTSTDKVYVLSN